MYWGLFKNMSNLFLMIPTKTKILIAALVGIIILSIVIIALQAPSQDDYITEQIPVISPENTIIGKRINLDTEKKLDIVKKEASIEGTLIYSLNSQNPIRTDQIITRNEQIVFQRTYIPEDPSDPSHLLISAMIEKHGQPEKVIQGSKLWGPFMNNYIYNTKGLAFIGNPNTDEVYELQNFTPLSLDEYIQKYGDDIDETPPGGES